MANHMVFCYGSLKAGFHNHPILYRDYAQPMGAASTAAPYLMLAGYAFPYLIDPATLRRKTDLAGIVGHIKGELYDIGDDTLTELDRLEGHPEFYRREQVLVCCEDHPEPVMAWVYFLKLDPNMTLDAPPVMPDAAGFVEWTQAHVTPFEVHDELIEGEE